MNLIEVLVPENNKIAKIYLIHPLSFIHAVELLVLVFLDDSCSSIVPYYLQLPHKINIISTIASAQKFLSFCHEQEVNTEQNNLLDYLLELIESDNAVPFAEILVNGKAIVFPEQELFFRKIWG